MRNILTITFIMLIIMWSSQAFLVYGKDNVIQPKEYIEDGKFKIYIYEKYRVYIFCFEGNFDYLYYPDNPLPLKELATRHGYRYVINGSFFEGNRLNSKHAGFLSICGFEYSKIKEDRQLPHVLQFNKETDTIKFTPYKEFSSLKNNNSIEFQTGPLVIENSNVSKDFIISSINGKGKHIRTLVGYSSDNIKYFIVVRERIELDVLGQYLLKLSVFSGKNFSIINLDGGPSVAFYSSNHPKLNFNESDNLPLLLGVK